jgi:phosphatidylserine/phosphatidylglycerophosphate/cardiolipin synthase-like enzyme
MINARMRASGNSAVASALTPTERVSAGLFIKIIRDVSKSCINFVILRARQNTWRIERAARAALLVDAGQYFAALRQALLGARRTVFILGWDIDSRMRLVGESGKADSSCSCLPLSSSRSR